MQYSPKLKRVMEDIKAILKKEDIAGIVVLHSVEGKPHVQKEGVYVEGFSELLMHINPSYSAANIENNRFQLKGKKEHYPSAEARDIKMANTVNMLEHLSKSSGMLSLNVMEINEIVKQKVQKLDDDPGSFTTHSQQNN